MSGKESEATESYSTFWDEPPVAATYEVVELNDPYAEFLAATEDDPEPTASEPAA